MKHFGFALLLMCSFASAQTIPLSINGADKCAGARAGDNFTGVVDHACAITPPPTDPGAYLSVIVKWLNGSNPPPQALTDVTSFWNLFGRVIPTLPVQGWPGAGGATISVADNSPKYYRWHLGSLPVNPGIVSHFLVAVSYGKSPPTLRANFAVVPVNAPWPTGPDSGCKKSNQPFSDQAVVNLNPIVIRADGSIVSGTVNTFKCSIFIRQDNPAIQQYDVLMDTIGNGVAALSFL